MAKTRTLVLIVTLVSILPLLLGGCGSPSAPQASGQLEGTITVSGAWALYPMMISWAEEYQNVHPGVVIDVSAGGAGKGMADALGGAVDIGMVSRDVTPEEEAKGAYWIAVTKDAVFPVVSSDNPVLAALLDRGISQATFDGLFISGEIHTWGQVIGQESITDEVHVYTRSDACGAAEIWAKFLGMKQEDLLGIGVFGDPGILEAVIKDPLGIGYNNLNYAFDTTTGKPVTGAVVIPLDVNGNGKAEPEEFMDTKETAVNAVGTGIYPSPPARALNLVTNGKPSGLVQDFIAWILTDGQQYVDAAGYVQLPADMLVSEQEKLQ